MEGGILKVLKDGGGGKGRWGVGCGPIDYNVNR